MISADDPNEWVEIANKWTLSTQGLLQESEDIDIVKISIILLGAFGFDDYEYSKRRLINMSLYGGFTLYSILALSRLANTSSILNPEQPIQLNDLVFSIAKSVDGWGRVHAVEHLEPTDDEIKRWLLEHGCEGGVLDMYIALNCAVKGDLFSVLKQKTLDENLLKGITRVFEGLLYADINIGGGINAYEHGKEALSLYMQHAKSRPDHLSDRVTDLLLALTAKEMLEYKQGEE